MEFDWISISIHLTVIVLLVVVGSFFGVWLLEKRKPKLEPLDKFDLYDPGERLIYKYFNGETTVSVDPVVIYKRLMGYLPDISHHVKVARSQHSDAHKAQGWLLEKIDAIFDTKPLNLVGKGLTELERMWLLDHFLIYNEAAKKNWKASPTLRKEISEHSSPYSEGSLRTRNGTGSGSSATESKTASPTESSPPSSLPSA